MSSTPPSSSHTLTLPERLDYAACETLAKDIAAKAGTPLQLEATSVRFLGALAAEIILRGQAEWASQELPFWVSDRSEAFTSGLQNLGIPENAINQEGGA